MCRKCSKSWRDPLSPLFWSQRYHQVKNWKKNLMLEGERNAPKFIYIAYVANIPQMKFVLQKPCLQCMIWLKIMVRPPQHIVLVPKGSPNEKFKKKFDARGWTKRSEVYVYSKNHTKWSLNHACNAWNDSTSWSDPLSPLFWSQRCH